MGSTVVSKFEAKSHDRPDERRTPPKTNVEVVRLEGAGFTLGRFTLAPGWRWSDCVKPVVKTHRCEVSHIGYCVSGRITVQLADGSTETIEPGSSYSIPPGHDAWVEGSEPFVGIEVMSAEVFAKPA
jgi:quercetin dioxygenase-like cupin family protein